MQRRSKYRAIPTTIDGIKFHSKGEATRYCELKKLQLFKVIRNLKLQVRYPLVVNGVKIADYYADFVYEETSDNGKTWTLITEDFKGYITPVYRLKRQLMLAVHGIKIRETK